MRLVDSHPEFARRIAKPDRVTDFKIWLRQLTSV